MAQPRETRMIEGVAHWRCSRCRRFLPRSGYFGEKAKPRGYCRECDKAFQRARESTGILTARQLEEAHYTALVERVLERSRILSLSFRACMVQAMEDWLSNAVATNHEATKATKCHEEEAVAA